MKAIERIYQYIDLKQITKSDFEKKCGISNGYLGKMYSRNADIGESILIQVLENCPDISTDWLITGTGSMLRLDTMSPVQVTSAAPIAPAPPAPTQAAAPTPQAPDASSMHYIMQRYEALVAENALLKKENEELKQSRGTRITTPSYTVSESPVSSHLAAEPRAHK